jgi:diguanylate cyclase (GGDEF)-like protein/PAS domain S-box-containing protein
MSDGSDLGVESLFRELDRRAQVEIFTRSPTPLVIIEHETSRLLAANDAAIALYHWQPTTIPTKALDDLTVSEDTIRLYAELSGPAPGPGEHSFRYERSDGQSMFLAFRCCRINYEGADALLLSISDVTEARILRSKLVRLLDASPDLVSTFDRSNHFVDVSTASSRILGFEPFELVGHTVYELVHPADRRRMLMEAKRLFDGGDPTSGFECRCLHKSGDFRWVQWSAAYSAVDDLIHCVGRDITDRKVLEEQLANSALHDPATGLANRALMIDRLNAAEASSEQTDVSFAVLLVRIDRLDFLYCALGKEASDNALLVIAKRISRVTRTAGTVGRVANDRFAILLTDATEASATGTAMQLRQVLTEPLEFEGEGIFSVDVTIGVVSSQQGVSSDGETLLENASIAADMARSTGQSIETFDVTYRDALRRRMKLESELRVAISEHQFHVLFQPVVRIKTGDVTAFEALLRWEHPTRGVLAPGEFIQVAEEAGLIAPIGSLVMRAVAAQMAAWRQMTGKETKVAVNVAMQQLIDGSFVQIVKECIAANVIQGPSLIIELTERAYMIGDDRIHEAVLALRLLRCELAMDDFGTGYSSLSCLKHLPVNVIKIDKSFVDGVTHDETDRALIDGIVTFAHALNMNVIAEGVETLDQLRALDALGCDMAQGFLIAKPMAADEARDRHLVEGPPAVVA